MPERELNQMPVRIANGREVSNHSANICRRIDQDILFLRGPGNSVNLFARIALKAEVIQTRFNFVLHYHQDERWVVS